MADEIRVEPNMLFSRSSDARAVYTLQTAAEAAEDESTQGQGGAAEGAN